MALKFEAKSVDVEDFLDALECQNITKATEHEFKFSCPFPGHQHGDQNPSAYMNIETSAWMCHGCKRKGNAVTFLAEHENITIMLATRFLHERYGGIGSDPDAYSARRELERMFEKQEAETQVENDLPISESFLDYYLIDWAMVSKADPIPEWGDYIFDRGFKPKTLNDWDIGFCDDTQRIVIPVHNQLGELIGFKGRSYREGHHPKYLVLRPGDFDRYHVSHHLFGLSRSEGDHLIVVEGELNVIALHQMGIKNCIAVNGSNFSERQALLLRQYAEQATIFFDSNDAGWDGTEMVCNALRDFMPVWVVPDHDFDPADCLDPSKSGDESSVRELIYAAESEIKIRLAHQQEA